MNSMHDNRKILGMALIKAMTRFNALPVLFMLLLSAVCFSCRSSKILFPHPTKSTIAFLTAKR